MKYNYSITKNKDGSYTLRIDNCIFPCADDTIVQLIQYLEKENSNLQQRIDKAIELAYQYAQIDGSHHKMWVINQMIRELLEKNYDKWVKDYEDDGEYSWDTGISP